MEYNALNAKKLAVKIRKNILRSIASKGTGHVGGSLSIADMLAVLYSGVMNVDPRDPGKKDRDFIVLSKGHCGPALYAALAAKGYFEEELLETLNQNNTMLPSHTDRLKTPGVDMTTGSLGQGASLAAGAAFADKLDHAPNYTYLILGDGELDEGQVWESFLFVAHHRLSNLITIVDVNGKQLDGTTEQVCDLGDIGAKFRAFLEAQEEQSAPSVLLLHTIKGAGIRKYEEMANCHSIPVNKEELPDFFEELDAKTGAEV